MTITLFLSVPSEYTTLILLFCGIDSIINAKISYYNLGGNYGGPRKDCIVFIKHYKKNVDNDGLVSFFV